MSCFHVVETWDVSFVSRSPQYHLVPAILHEFGELSCSYSRTSFASVRPQCEDSRRGLSSHVFVTPGGTCHPFSSWLCMINPMDVVGDGINPMAIVGDKPNGCCNRTSKC
jgi:hypothetical protein